MLAVPTLQQIEDRVCKIAVKQLGFDIDEVKPSSRLIEDLGCDSLDLIELLMEVEDTFDITIPDEPPNLVYKSVFTRSPFRMSDMAELVYLQLGTGKPNRQGWRKRIVNNPDAIEPFTQLSGRFDPSLLNGSPVMERIASKGRRHFRRRTDGMHCIEVPSAEVQIGNPSDAAPGDELPMHVVPLDSFIIDVEPVSTTAFCRFLNSIAVSEDLLSQWLLMDPADDRLQHQLIARTTLTWTPVAGCEQLPMILVSWHGADAYSRWANGLDGTDSSERALVGQFLPSETQWEYAARGAEFQVYPSGDESSGRSNAFVSTQHVSGERYDVGTLPLRPVHEPLGCSPFDLKHMAGNVWQWCRDWYDPEFYRSTAATEPNACNNQPTGVRSERGGSWVGPAELCRSSYRRGRAPYAMGRCLGFRCISRLG